MKRVLLVMGAMAAGNLIIAFIAIVRGLAVIKSKRKWLPIMLLVQFA